MTYSLPAKCNPFRSAVVEKIPFRFYNDSWADVMGRLESMQYRAAVVGPHGSGKTTFLEELQPRLMNLGFEVKKIFLNTESSALSRSFINEFFSDLNSSHLIILDGAEQMSSYTWNRFKRRTMKCAGCLVTTHRTGMLPTLLQCRTTVELLENIVNEIQDGAPCKGSLIPDLFAKHQGNLRECLRDLYDLQNG